MRAKLIMTAAVAVAALALAGAAAATTSDAYRAQVNALCRGYTPAVKKASAQLTAAQKANDAKAWGYSLGVLLGLGLSEDAKIRATPVPAAMSAQMTPILRLVKTVDADVHLALTKLSAGDGNGAGALLTKVAQIGKSLNKMYDAAGLRDCGSNQT